MQIGQVEADNISDFLQQNGIQAKVQIGSLFPLPGIDDSIFQVRLLSVTDLVMFKFQSYHAKKTSQERSRIFDQFCSNRLRVVSPWRPNICARNNFHFFLA